MKHVFISRELDSNSALARFCWESNLKLTAQPLIEFEPVETSCDAETMDVVFFTSPRSVEFFFQLEFKSTEIVYATIGRATADALKLKGHTASFIGSKSTHPDDVALEFKAWLGERKVLIPQSDRSNKTIEHVLNSDQYFPWVIYKTVLHSKRIHPSPDVIIFSSPSNAQAYFQMNALTMDQQFIAFGATTANYLKQKHGIAAIIPEGLSDNALIEAVKKIS